MADPSGSVEHVSAEEAIELSTSGTTLIDVREQWEWDAGHAPQATHIPLGELGARLDELPRESLLVICHSGGRSLTAASALSGAGYSTINVLGGMMAWEQSGGEVVRPAADEPHA